MCKEPAGIGQRVQDRRDLARVEGDSEQHACHRVPGPAARSPGENKGGQRSGQRATGDGMTHERTGLEQHKRRQREQRQRGERDAAAEQQQSRQRGRSDHDQARERSNQPRHAKHAAGCIQRGRTRRVLRKPASVPLHLLEAVQ